MANKELTLIILIFSTFLTVSGPAHACMTPPARVLIEKEIRQLNFFVAPKRQKHRQKSQALCNQEEKQSCEKWSSFYFIHRSLMLISGVLVTILLILGLFGRRGTSDKDSEPNQTNKPVKL